MPTQADVARIIGRNVDPALVHRAHRGLMKLIGKTLGRQLEDLYAEMDASGPFSPDAQSAGRRALRNAALTLLTARGTPADIARLSKHYSTATNMTDRAHALFQLAYRGGAEAKQALADFYERWHSGQRRHRYLVCRAGAVAARRHAGPRQSADAATRCSS